MSTFLFKSTLQARFKMLSKIKGKLREKKLTRTASMQLTARVLAHDYNTGKVALSCKEQSCSKRVHLSTGEWD